MSTRFPFSRSVETGRFLEDTFGLTGNGFTPADVTAFLGGSSPFAFGTLSFSAMTAVIKVLKNDENTAIRQAPRLMVLNHEPGTVFVGETVRWAEIFSASSQGGTLATGVREADNSPVNTGFQLLVVPHIVAGTNDILMTVIPESNSLTEFKTFGTSPNIIELPQIASSTVVTQMLVRDGETAVIGGLVTDRDEDQVRKVPFLGDVPLVGYLFKWKHHLLKKEHLMIFITPRVVRTAKDARRVLVCHEKFDWPEAPCPADQPEGQGPAAATLPADPEASAGSEEAPSMTETPATGS
jgi:general secretion pathway protein D